MFVKRLRFNVLSLCLVLGLALSVEGCGVQNAENPDNTAEAPKEAEGGISQAYIGGYPEETAEDDQPGDGAYKVSVTLEGGSGKASVFSPASLILKDGFWTLRLKWSSSNYDYMVVDKKKYLPVSTEGGSLFEIPLSGPVGELKVSADTTAMETPHEIEYTLIFSPAEEDGSVADENYKSGGNGSASPEKAALKAAASGSVSEWRNAHKPDSQMDLKYAAGFSVDCYEDGSSLVTINESGDVFFLLPEEAKRPQDLPDGVTVLNVPLDRIYLASTAAMDMFRAMDGLCSVRFSSLNASGWDMPKVREAMDNGDILYAGKYSTPDYERLLAGRCDLAIENTMIYHSPQAKEQLEHLNIPVLVEYSSYEPEPLGRSEWIRLYGLLCGREEEADKAFEEQETLFLNAASGAPSHQTVAFFYLTQNGEANVRRSSDYIARMIEMAGGEYIFPDTGSDNDHSPAISMQMEEFYAGAKEADILIYNGTVEGEIHSIDELISKNALLSGFRAVQNGNVFCAKKSMYQASMEMGTILSDLRAIITGDDENLLYFYRLQ